MTYCKACGQRVEEDDPKGHWFSIMGIGTEGVEMLHSGQDGKEAAERLELMLLRARFNAHRRIQVFTWADCNEVTLEKLDKKRIALVMRCAEKVY